MTHVQIPVNTILKHKLNANLLKNVPRTPTPPDRETDRQTDRQTHTHTNTTHTHTHTHTHDRAICIIFTPHSFFFLSFFFFEKRLYKLSSKATAQNQEINLGPFDLRNHHTLIPYTLSDPTIIYLLVN